MATAIAPSNVPTKPLSTCSTPRVVDFVDDLWRNYAPHISNGNTNEVRIPFPLKAIIGQQGMDIIKTRFEYMIGRPVDTYENYFRGYSGMRVAPDRGPKHLLTHNAPELKMKKKVADKKTKVPRPPNAFILYRQHHHPLVKAEYPDMHNNQISIILGTQWKNETVSNKLHWNNVADEIKKKHFQDNPEYSYQPRKPSEKKRRMTRRKAAVLAGMTDTLVAPSSSVQISSSTAFAPVQSGPTISAPVSLTGNFYQQTTPPSDELPVGVPAFQKTESGNAIVDIGDADISDAMLSALLDDFNKHQPAMVLPNRQLSADHVEPIMYMEDDEVSASDKNFYLNLVDFDKLFNEHQAEVAKIATVPDTAAAANAAWSSLTLSQQTTLFDLNNPRPFESESEMLNRLYQKQVADTLKREAAEAASSVAQGLVQDCFFTDLVDLDNTN